MISSFSMSLFEFFLYRPEPPLLPLGVEKHGRVLIELRLPLYVGLHGAVNPVLDLPNQFRSHLLRRRLYHQNVRRPFLGVAGQPPSRKFRERKVDLFMLQHIAPHVGRNLGVPP